MKSGLFYCGESERSTCHSDVACWCPQSGARREEGMESWGSGVWEYERGHSRPAALRVEEPGSASFQTDPALFSGGQPQRGHACAPYISNLWSIEERSAHQSVRLPKITPKSAAATFETEETGGRLHSLCWHFQTLKGCQCSTTFLSSMSESPMAVFGCQSWPVNGLCGPPLGAALSEELLLYVFLSFSQFFFYLKAKQLKPSIRFLLGNLYRLAFERKTWLTSPLDVVLQKTRHRLQADRFRKATNLYPLPTFNGCMLQEWQPTPIVF